MTIQTDPNLQLGECRINRGIGMDQMVADGRFLSAAIVLDVSLQNHLYTHVRQVWGFRCAQSMDLHV